MSRIRVIYGTKTGHSKKLAEAIGQAVQVRVEDVMAGPEAAPADLLFIVGGIYGGKSLPELVGFVQRLQPGQVKQAVLVTTSVSVGGRKQADIRGILQAKGVDVVDELACPGSLLFLKRGHPNAADIQAVASRASQIAAR